MPNARNFAKKIAGYRFGSMFWRDTPAAAAKRRTRSAGLASGYASFKCNSTFRPNGDIAKEFASLARNDLCV